ncbi:hypothetical protein [Arachidicoccus terrestris]|uniref:hypothetical protein n=1 Tax=Arachidicoccus terrestris TaxID=2875539 RepID=UPI001CC4D146|nr:hypothetical protein [Arachidicoccus terrestris]UAY56275.1 hypothetical protein K9M52_04455 [Arachidicoccus terrestris]
MATYTGNNAWVDEIYNFEETDIVQGGPDGIDNLPLQQLADRTQYLYGRLGLASQLVGEIILSSNALLDDSFAGKLIIARSSNNTALTITLADSDSFPDFSILPISSFCAGASVIKIVSGNGQYFYDTDGNRSEVYMHHKEHLYLMASGGHWKIVNAIGNFYCVGEEVKSRKQLINTLPAMGQLINRTFYPRLWEFVDSLSVGHEVISDSLWLSSPTKYRGFFSTGDGSSTFRMPDERAMFERMLDLGRGIEFKRVPNYAGGYQADEMLQHNHTTEKIADRGWPDASGDRSPQQYWMDAIRDPSAARLIQVNNAGTGSETVVKNIGKLFLIKY